MIGVIINKIFIFMRYLRQVYIDTLQLKNRRFLRNFESLEFIKWKQKNLINEHFEVQKRFKKKKFLKIFTLI